MAAVNLVVDGSLSVPGSLAVTGAGAVNIAGIAVPSSGICFGPVSVATGNGAVTMTAAQMVSGYFHGTPGAAVNYTTDSAANIIALVGSVVGTRFCFWIRNDSGGANAVTVVAGANVTLFAANTNTIAQAHTRQFMAEVTAADAVTIYSMMDSAH